MTCKELLCAVSAIGEGVRLKRATGDRFNVFTMCNVKHYETLHSKIIAEFLDPNGAHGCGSMFLAALFEVVGVEFPISTATKVMTESVCENGRMDILIQGLCLDNRWAVVIENKIHAGEQIKQIPRYWRALRKELHEEQIAVAFLTLDGHDSETAKDLPIAVRRERIKSVSYEKHIVEWLGKCIAIAAELPCVRESLCQYRNFIMKLVNDEQEESFMQDIIKKVCLSSSDSFLSAMRIANAAQGVRDAVIRRIVKCSVGLLPRGEKIQVDFDEDLGATYAGFGFACSRSPFSVWFEFQTAGCRNMCAGLVWAEYVKRDKTMLAKMKRKASEIGWKTNDGWANWNYFTEYRNWNDDVLSESLRSLEQNDYGGLIGSLHGKMSKLVQMADEFNSDNGM